jgi:site-specific DNA-methyltransferase (adenine-specific)
MNVFDYNYVPSASRIHPLERPIEMMEDIISTFVPPASTIMVPFLGSGNTLLAAYNLGCEGFGFDLNQAYRDAYVVRVTGQELGDYKSYREKKR